MSERSQQSGNLKDEGYISKSIYFEMVGRYHAHISQFVIDTFLDQQILGNIIH
ncbi:hypothetical protein [Xenorhabdus bovienii]|uniref:hypothetical protein n=1 Tax=Xenorhabdus bovienii TaxID=40576 RepID=UPI000ACBC13C|nr:hypothetical protein [Xenorhabdus bovienii]MDE9446588.1 hypothetical protein [Xenorhabdus bovienii]